MNKNFRLETEDIYDRFRTFEDLINIQKKVNTFSKVEKIRKMEKIKCLNLWGNLTLEGCRCLTSEGRRGTRMLSGS